MHRFFVVPGARLARWAGLLATLVMLALVAWLGARIFWSLNTPDTVAPLAPIETDPARAAQAIAGRHMFGEVPKAGSPAVKAVVVDIVLRGVVAASSPGRRGLAVLAVAGKPPVAVAEGNEVAPGVKLRQVLPRSVDLERDGQVQSVALPERSKAGPQPPQQPAVQGQRPQRGLDPGS